MSDQQEDTKVEDVKEDNTAKFVEFSDEFDNIVNHTKLVPLPVVTDPFYEPEREEFIKEINTEENLSKKERKASFDRAIQASSTSHERYGDIYREGIGDGLLQNAKHEGKSLAVSRQIPKDIVTGGAIEGKSAIMAMSTFMGRGTDIEGRLWNSGIRFKLRGIERIKFHTLMQSIETTRITLGYDTKGVIFSGDDVIANEKMFNFFFEHLEEVNIKNADKDMLLKLVKATDLQTIAAALLISMYPNGYPSLFNCKNSLVGKCSKPNIEVDEKGFKYDSLLDFRKVIRFDGKRLKDEDYAILLAEWNTITEKEILAYQKRRELSNNEVTVIQVDTNNPNFGIVDFTIVGESPSLATYFECGKQWITGITKQVNEVIANSDITDEDELLEERNKQINYFNRVARGGRHVSWIKEIVITPTSENSQVKPSNIPDKDAILHSLINDFGEDVEKQIRDALYEYKSKSTVSICAYASRPCAYCGHEGTSTDGSNPDLISLDTTVYLFTVGQLEMSQV